MVITQMSHCLCMVTEEMIEDIYSMSVVKQLTLVALLTLITPLTLSNTTLDFSLDFSRSTTCKHLHHARLFLNWFLKTVVSLQRFHCTLYTMYNAKGNTHWICLISLPWGTVQKLLLGVKTFWSEYLDCAPRGFKRYICRR